MIRANELQWRFSGSGGPGGQHANTANTRVELRFDIAASASLGPRQRARLVQRFGPLLRVVASDERSQLANRTLARRRMAERIADALTVRPARQATRPTKSSQERRLAEKQRRSSLKRGRSAGDYEW